jgi:TfoX/Sxy family transcriptional regulator of competence genes
MSAESEELGERIRGLIGHKPGVIEKRMFGGFGFMLHGNMVAGAMSTGELLLRADPSRMDEALSITGAAPMKMGERVMTGFYTVDFDAIANDDDLKAWLDRSWAYVKTLPPKPEKPAAKKAAKKPAVKPAKAAPAKKAPRRT